MTKPHDDSESLLSNLAHRRGFLEALGAAVGASALAGCSASASDGRPSSAVEALVGATPVSWIDAVNVDLRTATAYPAALGSTVVIARGYAAANDGGGGVFSWDPTSATGDDGGTIIVPPISGAQAGRWVRIWSDALDIRWFGAVAGSATAATANDAALQKAIAAAARANAGVNAGRVLVPQGQWYISATIALTQIDSVLLTSAGGAGTWGVSGAYGHQSTKLLWAGGAGTMVSFSQTFRCGMQGILLDGGGAATVGLSLDGPSNPAKGCLFEDLAVINLASSGVAIHVGSPSNPDVAFNTFRRFYISGGAVGVLQEGNQSAMNVFEDGVVVGAGQYGMQFAAGEITVSRCLFAVGATATADVFVSRRALWARFLANYHETVCPTTYLFEPTSAGNLRPQATLFLSVRVLHQRIASPQRIIDFQQDGHLSLVACQFEGIAGQNQPDVYLAPPDMGYTDLGLIQEIGCRYSNGAHAVVAPINGAYSSLYSNGAPVLPPPGPIVGEHVTAYTRHTVHNGAVQVQDNSWFDGTNHLTKGVRLTSYLGQLFVDSMDTRTGGLLFLVRNNGTAGFSVNYSGGPGFYGTTVIPASKPTVTGSRGGNAALADLLTKLASFGLITDGTTP